MIWVTTSLICKLLFLVLAPAVGIHAKFVTDLVIYKMTGNWYRWTFAAWSLLIFTSVTLASDIAFGLYLLLYVRGIFEIYL